MNVHMCMMAFCVTFMCDKYMAAKWTCVYDSFMSVHWSFVWDSFMAAQWSFVWDSYMAAQWTLHITKHIIIELCRLIYPRI